MHGALTRTPAAMALERRTMGSLFRRSLASLAIVGVLALGCGGQVSDPAAPRTDPILPPGEYLLFEPTAASEELLGKPVVFDDQGAFRIADYRAPGCQVDVLTSPDAWTREFGDHAGHLVSAGGGLAALVSISGKHEKTAYSAMTIHNTQVLRGRLKNCGRNVITKVKVGSGDRKIYRARSTSGGASVKLPSTDIGAALEAQDFERLKMDLSWDTEQAWGFELGGAAEDEGLALEVTIDPETVHDGDSYRVRVRSDTAAQLVIIAQEDASSGGRAAVILPVLADGRKQTVSLRAGQWKELPPAEATLRDAGTEQLDRLIVYALRHEADLNALELTYGELSDDEHTEQAQRVMKQLSALPPASVARQDVGYRIVPR